MRTLKQLRHGGNTPMNPFLNGSEEEKYWNSKTKFAPNTAADLQQLL